MVQALTALLYRLAEPQAGYFTAAEAVEAGISYRALTRRVRSGDIERVRYGLYRLKNFPPHQFEDVVAACLWAGKNSAASHETALSIHKISDALPNRIHITVPNNFRGHRPGIVVHQSELDMSEREMREGVPVTTVARTLQDIAAVSDPSLVKQAISQAVDNDVLSRRQLRRLTVEKPMLAPLIVDALTDGKNDSAR